MRLVKSIFTALFIAGLFVALAGCGASPATFAKIPLHPDAMPLARGSNTLADSIADALESSLSKGGKVEMKLYSVPNTVIWEEIDGFYTEALSDSDWKAADELRQESAAITTTGWTRGSLASEQGLLVGYAPDVSGDGAFLIVALFSE
jgi:hypothetical protein